MISIPTVDAAPRNGTSAPVPVADALAAHLPRLLGAILNDERRAVAGSGAAPVAPTFDTAIGEEGFGFDSLARLGLVARLNRFFGLAETGIEDYLLLEPTFGRWLSLIEEHCRKTGLCATVTFSTSGTTRAPRDVPRALSDLWLEAEGHRARFLPDDAAAGRILAAVPPFHIYGFLFTILLPGLTGREVVDVTGLGPGAAARLARCGDLVVATPTVWQAMFASSPRFARGVAGVTAGSAAEGALWSAAGRAGLATLVEVYGATETGGVGVRTGASDPFDLLEHLDREGETVRPRTGRQAPLPLQDKLDWVAPTRFRLSGRIDGAVQIGGVTVWPGAVADWLENQPGVSSASVRFDGTRLKAFVVPANRGAEEEGLAARLRRAMAEGLTAPERPVTLTFGERLPLSPVGKPADWS